MKLIILALISTFSTCLLASDGDCTHTKKSFNCVKYVSNYDGDTVRVNIPSTHPMFGNNADVRVYGVDTPELHPSKCKLTGRNAAAYRKCIQQRACEKVKAKQAKEIVEYFLSEGKRIDLVDIDRGKYFRIVADIIVDEISIRELLISWGLAVPYYGDTKQQVNWCAPQRAIVKLSEEIERNKSLKKSKPKKWEITE